VVLEAVTIDKGADTKLSGGTRSWSSQLKYLDSSGIHLQRVVYGSATAEALNECYSMLHRLSLDVAKCREMF
jgi:hypothetical protein